MLLRHTVFRGVLGITLALAAMGASDEGRRYDALSHQMMCTCGCAQILGECNHVGCPNSGPMLAELRKDIGGGMGDRAILVAFSQEYGPESLASPLLTRFNQLAWWAPPMELLLGLIGALMMLRRWKRNRTPVPVAATSASVRSAEEQVRLERIRREAEIE